MIGAALSFVTGGSATRLTATLLAGALLGGWGMHQVHRAAQAMAQAEQQRQTLRAITAAQAETTRLQEAADEANRRAAARTQSQQRAAAGARAELDRLRDQLATAAPGGSPACPARR